MDSGQEGVEAQENVTYSKTSGRKRKQQEVTICYGQQI